MIIETLADLVGRRVTLNIPGRTTDTISWQITGYARGELRFETPQHVTSSMPFADFRVAIASGIVRFVE